jgi:hypothetical protein
VRLDTFAFSAHHPKIMRDPRRHQAPTLIGC